MTGTLFSPAPVLAEIEAAARTDRNRAIDLAIKALGAGHEDPLVLHLVADGLEEDGRLPDAVALSHRATVVAPTQVDVWMVFGRRLRMLGRLEDALEAARTALALAPDSYIAQLEAAGGHLVLNNFAAAADHAEQARMLCPRAPEPLSTLAIIAARQNRFSAARKFAEQAIALSPGLPGAEIVLAKADMADGHAAFAVLRLERLAGRRDVSEGHRAEALTALGDALDAIKAPARAFGAYAASNAIMGRFANAAGVGETRSALDHARELERYFREAAPAPWRKPAGGGDGGQIAARHVFLVGFPRSGTTLLENALTGHPDIAALEEADALARCGGDLLADSAHLQRLAQLTGEEARAAREIYWTRVRALAPEAASAKVFIDKMPVQTVALPLITKLFPDAKILFARRDPRDVVLSCFRRLFGINTVMSQFLTLDGAARYYDQVMRLAVLYGEKLLLDLHIVRHEDLVADFDRELSRILDFFGLPWDARVRDFEQRAIWSRTPSATQIARGLNAEGVGAWRRFQGELAPVLPLLEPWVARFGYPPADPAPLPSRAR